MNKQLVILGGQRYYEVISYLKGFSILTIVVMHMIQVYLTECPAIITKASSIGGSGVHVFFFCSGFGLYLSYKGKNVDYFGFLKKRFLKIYLPYIAVVAISALIPFMYEGNHLRAFCSHVFLYKMFIPKYESSFGIQLWFVSTLFQFYFMFIPFYRLRKKVGNRLFLAISLIISIGWWVFTALLGLSTERIWGSFFLQYLWEFSLGMVIADWLNRGKDIKFKRVGLLLASVGGIGVAAVAWLIGGTLTVFNDIFSMMGYSAIALLVYSLGIKFIKNFILYISKISYELYLVHMLIFSLLFTFIGISGKMEYLLAIVAVATAFIVAHIYHWLISEIQKIYQK
jgi:peptidoglycan/LPS O-acetylase OafA/YrhL